MSERRPATGSEKPETLPDADLDVTAGGATSSHRRQTPVSLATRLGKSGEADEFASTASGSPNI